MRKLLLLSLFSSGLCVFYVQQLPKDLVLHGQLGQVTSAWVIGSHAILNNKVHPRDCVDRWEDGASMPNTFVYNSMKKACTPLMSVFGTKKALNGEEAYFIESSQDICKRNVTKAVEDITVTCRKGWNRLELASAVNCYQIMTDFTVCSFILLFTAEKYSSGPANDVYACEKKFSFAKATSIHSKEEEQFLSWTASVGRCYYGGFYWKKNFTDMEYSGGDVNDRPFICKYVASF
uniref:C-type lectin domain-containing protein n=1 Tax=Steinernema glaseri TaxID=37863 RepID=A0A1I7ZZF4_9BILA